MFVAAEPWSHEASPSGVLGVPELANGPTALETPRAIAPTHPSLQATYFQSIFPSAFQSTS
jgi:hypothetical protein